MARGTARCQGLALPLPQPPNLDCQDRMRVRVSQFPQETTFCKEICRTPLLRRTIANVPLVLCPSQLGMWLLPEPRPQPGPHLET
jgi:hypothetical protein